MRIRLLITMRFPSPAFLLIFTLFLAAPCHARQDAPPEVVRPNVEPPDDVPDAPAPPSPAPVRKKTPPRPVLEMIRYNPETDGALFFVRVQRDRENEEGNESESAPEMESKPDLPRLTAAQFAASISHRLMRENHVSAIVPQTMFVVAPVPKEGDPLYGMRAGERFQLLLGTFSAAQWAKAGSDAGIGAGDMTDEQRVVFSGLFPAQDFEVQTYRLSPQRGEEDEPVWEPADKPRTHPVSGTRLRLRRQTTVSFPDAEGNGYFGTVSRDYDDDHFKPGDTKTDLVNGYSLTGDTATERVEGEEISFGVRLSYTEPNRAKPSDLNLDSAALKPTLVLDGSHKTVGDLIAACAKKTSLELRADKRMAAMPIQWRVAKGGHAAPVGEVLSVLCRSLTGTFRVLTPTDGSPRVYLLTDDREGLGTRLARLSYWHQKMNMTKESLVRKAALAAARFDPLSHVRFAPDDPLALPPTLSNAADAAYRASEDGVAAKIADLPPALRERLTQQVKAVGEYDKEISPNRIRLGSTMLCEYVFPGGDHIATGFGGDMSTDYLKNAANPAPRPKPAKPVKPVPPLVLTRTTPRRVCLVPLPAKDDIKTLLSLLRAKGFTEAWLAVPLRVPGTPERLAEAVAVGQSLGIKVGASASWLKPGENETGGTEDLNISGENGKRAMQQFMEMFGTMWAQDPSAPPPEEVEYVFDFLNRYMSGWIVPDGKTDRAALQTLLAVPELSAVVLTDTVAPGWGSGGENNGGMPPGLSLGATLPVRIACVRGVGVDPIDAVEPGFPVGYVPLFGGGAYNTDRDLQTFRFAENRRELALLTEGVKPTVPLFLENPAPFFQTTDSGFSRFAPESLKPKPPTPGTLPPTETLAAFAPSFEYGTEKMVEGLTKVVRKKNGFVVNFGQLRPADALRYLKLLADAPVK
ncbi:MAG: hypothetical protein H7Y38_12510 [Armatimonadetes bacterium]|nr:hypothetical protein [Armatimonadota bacterium]